ncbi:MAG TPA: hypothetical protein VJV78_36955 [Polyangiales bacterium]|nr:hypothetical protein [Polyangiales bacterium]
MLRSVFIALALGFSLLGCTSRTLPLPPPEVSSVSAPDADGFVSVSGYALEGASVGVFNDRTGDGVVVPVADEDSCDNTCAWEARIRAQVGDSLRVWQFFETEGSIDVSVPKPK